MKAVKRIAVAAISSALVLSLASVKVFAATTEKELDGVTITYTTDKDEYATNDDIHAKITLKASSDKNLDLIDFYADAPEGYTVDSATRSSTEVSEGEDGEGAYVIYELEADFIRNHSDEYSRESSEISEILDDNESSVDGESSIDGQSSVDGESSADGEISTTIETSEDSKVSESTEVSEDASSTDIITSSQTSTTSTTSITTGTKTGTTTGTTSTVSSASTTVGTTSSESTAAAGTVKTSDSTNVLLIAVIFTAAAALSFFCIKNKKARKFLSIMICTAVIGGAAVAVSANTSAVTDEEPDTAVESGREKKSFPYQNEVAAMVLIDGEKTYLSAYAVYNIDTEVVTFSGTVRNSEGDPVANADVKITSESGDTYVPHTEEDGKYSASVPYKVTEPYTIEVTADGYKPVKKSIIEVEENRIINVVLDREEEEQEVRRSLGFRFDNMKSQLGDKLVNEYGSMICTNKDAVIKKAAGCLYRFDGGWQMTIAFVGENITEAKYVAYYADDEEIVYSGLDEDTTLYSVKMAETDGMWSVYGEFVASFVNIDDEEGKKIAFQSKDIIGTNLRVFTNHGEMKAWLLSED